MITALRERRVGTDARADAVTAATRWWLDAGIVAPIGAAIAYLVVVAVRLPGLLTSFYWYSDFPETLRLGVAVFHGGYGQGLPVPSQSGLGPLWLIGLLNQLTGSDAAGMAVGGVLVAAAAGFIVWTAHRVIGPRGALAAGVLCVAAPPVVGWEAVNPVAHETTLLLTAVCVWQLVALARAPRGRMLGSSIAVGVLAGICLISDPMVIAAAVAPWVICAVIVVLRQPERRIAVAVTTGSTAISSVLIAVLASASGVVERSNAGLSPSLNGITSGLRTTALTLGQMITGVWYGASFPEVIAMAAFALFAALLYMVTREVTRRSPGVVAGRDLYVWFWMLSCGGLIAGLCLTGLGIQYDPINQTGHYVDGLWFAIAALLPLGLLQRSVLRRTIAVSVTALVVTAAIGVARTPSYPFEEPDYVDGPQLTATLAQLGLQHGYGGYWESYAIGWHTDQRITALPLQQCRSSAGVKTLCHYEFSAPAWFTAKPGPVFVVALTGSCYNNDLCINVANLAAFPKPEAVRTVGLLQVYVYADDIFAGLPIATRP
ncbi:MAG: hypothetical protein WCB51_05105 [Candidatus Dormiibacterota bacterium]